MIESVQFRNFKALRDTALPLGRFTLIVGPNGSGKTTAIQALLAMHNPAKVADRKLATAGTSVTEKNPVEVMVKWGAPQAGVMTRSRFLPTRSGPEHLRQQEKPLPKHHHKALSDSLAAIKAYSLRADAVWKPVGLIPSIELTEDGGGLAGVLTDLRDSHEERSDALRAEFKRWFVEYDAIILRTISQGTRAFLLRTRDGHHEIPAAQLSQGTLLALCMLTLAYLPEPPPLVCFEEPDRGLHPRLLRDVQDALYRLSYPENYGEEREPVQVVATTHSPYMLDLYRDHPEEIVIAQKVGIEARFERLIDQPNIEEILSGAPLGEVWYTGILGGVPLEK